MKHSNTLFITSLTALLLVTLSAGHADESSDRDKQIETPQQSKRCTNDFQFSA